MRGPFSFDNNTLQGCFWIGAKPRAPVTQMFQSVTKRVLFQRSIALISKASESDIVRRFNRGKPCRQQSKTQ